MISKRITPLLILIAFSLPAVAQQVTSVAPAPGFSHADTIRAVQRLFQKHRAGGWIWTTAGALLTGRVVGGAVAGNVDANSLPISLLVFGGVPFGIGIGKLTRFGQNHEQEIITSDDKLSTLPPYVRRRLKPKYFKR